MSQLRQLSNSGPKHVRQVELHSSHYLDIGLSKKWFSGQESKHS